MAIENVSIADNGHLIIVLEDGTVKDAGNVRGIPGPEGPKGDRGMQGMKGDDGPMGPGLLGYNSGCINDGVPLQLDNIIVQMSTARPRSLQFKTASGTLSVNITGQIYWAKGDYSGNWGATYWTGNTLTTSWQQIFGWDFPWQGDIAIYHVQDLTNKRFYRITLSIGAGYKNNFIIMERLV